MMDDYASHDAVGLAALVAAARCRHTNCSKPPARIERLNRTLNAVVGNCFELARRSVEPFIQQTRA